MKKIALILGLTLVGVLQSNAQCSLNTDDGVYESTCFQELYGKYAHVRDFASPAIEVAIAKNGNSGLFILKTAEGELKDAYLYLDDNDIIKLYDRNIQWEVNYETFALYYLTESEIEKLKRSNIRAVRYWACSFAGYNNCNDGATEVYNKTFETNSLSLGKKKYEKIEFPKLITDLFDN